MKTKGLIANILTEKGFGFIKPSEGGETYFFHRSAYAGDWQHLKQGMPVQFSTATVDGRIRGIGVELDESTVNPLERTNQRSAEHRKRRIDPYEGPTLALSDEARKHALEEISRWKLEAKLDDMKRYFFAVPELNDIVTGDASYVIGRKGTGKTALVQYLSAGQSLDMLATKLTFKNFPFNELYDQSNSRYTRPNQYITIWKLIIYSAACRLIARSKMIDPLVARTIEKAFPEPDSDNLATIIGKWIAGDFGISILGTGVNISRWFKEKRPFSLQEKVENIESFVKKNVVAERIMILFDELDEDYKEIFENFHKSEYLDLLTSLFKAVQDIRSVMMPKGIHIYPVIFLRDDIYDLILDADKNKWRDLVVNLKWEDDEIQGLLAYRLSKVMGAEVEEFNKLWYSIFDKRPVAYSGGKKEIPSFDYIRMSTQGRPRDYINYLQECASIELKRSKREISEESIKDADKAYSNYLRKEIIDEIHGLLPEVAKILSIFSERRKWILGIDEFKRAYQERVRAGTMKVADADFVLKTLFYFSVIGNVVRPGVHIFRHARPDAELNFKEPVVVHRGLMKSLQIL